MSAPAWRDTQFDGSIPEAYNRYLGPLLFEPFARDIAARVAKLEPTSVLEIAAGTGLVTRRLLEALPRVRRLTATDLNEPMLAYARARIGGNPPLQWRRADALDLPFDDGEFDAVVCQFGIMFFPDKPRAMREFHRVLAPGGDLLFSVWDSFEHNPLAVAIHTSIAEVLPENPPAFYQIPYGYHDVGELRTLTTSAGFSSVQVEAVD